MVLNTVSVFVKSICNNWGHLECKGARKISGNTVYYGTDYIFPISFLFVYN
jgi:hypothetical protein